MSLAKLLRRKSSRKESDETEREKEREAPLQTSLSRSHASTSSSTSTEASQSRSGTPPLTGTLASTLSSLSSIPLVEQEHAARLALARVSTDRESLLLRTLRFLLVVRLRFYRTNEQLVRYASCKTRQEELLIHAASRASTLHDLCTRTEETRKFLVNRVRCAAWEKRSHFHLTACDHMLGNVQPALFDVATMLRGHLGIAALARSVMARASRDKSAALAIDEEKRRHVGLIALATKLEEEAESRRLELAHMIVQLRRNMGEELERFLERKLRSRRRLSMDRDDERYRSPSGKVAPNSPTSPNGLDQAQIHALNLYGAALSMRILEPELLSLAEEELGMGDPLIQMFETNSNTMHEEEKSLLEQDRIAASTPTTPSSTTHLSRHRRSSSTDQHSPTQPSDVDTPTLAPPNFHAFGEETSEQGLSNDATLIPTSSSPPRLSTPSSSPPSHSPLSFSPPSLSPLSRSPVGSSGAGTSLLSASIAASADIWPESLDEIAKERVEHLNAHHSHGQQSHAQQSSHSRAVDNVSAPSIILPEFASAAPKTSSSSASSLQTSHSSSPTSTDAKPASTTRSPPTSPPPPTPSSPSSPSSSSSSSPSSSSSSSSSSGYINIKLRYFQSLSHGGGNTQSAPISTSPRRDAIVGTRAMQYWKKKEMEALSMSNHSTTSARPIPSATSSAAGSLNFTPSSSSLSTSLSASPPASSSPGVRARATLERGVDPVDASSTPNKRWLLRARPANANANANTSVNGSINDIQPASPPLSPSSSTAAPPTSPSSTKKSWWSSLFKRSKSKKRHSNAPIEEQQRSIQQDSDSHAPSSVHSRAGSTADISTVPTLTTDADLDLSTLPVLPPQSRLLLGACWSHLHSLFDSLTDLQRAQQSAWEQLEMILDRREREKAMEAARERERAKEREKMEKEEKERLEREGKTETAQRTAPVDVVRPAAPSTPSTVIKHSPPLVPSSHAISSSSSSLLAPKVPSPTATPSPPSPTQGAIGSGSSANAPSSSPTTQPVEVRHGARKGLILALQSVPAPTLMHTDATQLQRIGQGMMEGNDAFDSVDPITLSSLAIAISNSSTLVNTRAARARASSSHPTSRSTSPNARTLARSVPTTPTNHFNMWNARSRSSELDEHGYGSGQSGAHVRRSSESAASDAVAALFAGHAGAHARSNAFPRSAPSSVRSRSFTSSDTHHHLYSTLHADRQMAFWHSHSPPSPSSLVF